jgi:hypothetical protein
MATMKCPQCGTEFDRESHKFCPNPSCGYPVSFAEEPETPPAVSDMERRPGEQATAPLNQPTVPPPQQQPPPVVQPPPVKPKTPRKGAPIGLIIGGVVLAIAAILAVVVLTGGEESPQEEEDEATPTTAPAQPIDIRFNRVPPDEAVFGGEGDQVINRLLATPTGVVAVGYDTSGGDEDAAVWTSVDGTRWNRVAHDEEVFGGAGDQQMWSAVSGGSGLIVVGYDSSGGEQDSAVWTSDGVAFRRVEHREGVFGGLGDQSMLRVIQGGPGFVAVGFDDASGDRSAAVWTSREGRDWARLNPNENVFGGPGEQVMRSIVLLDSQLVAVGDDGSGGDLDAAAWVSDGNVFTRVFSDETVFGGQGDQRMFTAFPGGPGLIGVGEDASGGDSDAAVWTTTNGQVWKKLPPDELVFGGTGDQLMNSLAGDDRQGYVGVGSGVLAEDPTNQDGAAWQSQDGRTWDKIKPTQSIFGGPGEQEMKFVTVTNGLAIAGGWDGSGGDLDAAIWTSSFPAPD